MRHIATYLIGLVFGIGISLSGMANPAKVLNFFDFLGTWDPSLLLVMAGAVGVTFVGYRIVLKRPAPLFEKQFLVPGSRVIDARLVGGSALFGVGWGITGFCPGASLPALGTGNADVLVFSIALVAGIFAARMAMQLTETLKSRGLNRA